MPLRSSYSINSRFEHGQSSGTIFHGEPFHRNSLMVANLFVTALFTFQIRFFYYCSSQFTAGNVYSKCCQNLGVESSPPPPPPPDNMPPENMDVEFSPPPSPAPENMDMESSSSSPSPPEVVYVPSFAMYIEPESLMKLLI